MSVRACVCAAPRLPGGGVAAWGGEKGTVAGPSGVMGVGAAGLCVRPTQQVHRGCWKGGRPGLELRRSGHKGASVPHL